MIFSGKPMRQFEVRPRYSERLCGDAKRLWSSLELTFQDSFSVFYRTYKS
jgi:hypothetical protein